VRVGIDAKWFFEGPPSGRNVVRNLIEQVILQNTEHDLFIILDARWRYESFPYKDQKVHLVYVWADNNLLANVFAVPLIVWKLHLDILVFQNFVPFIANFKSIAFIHDAIFLSNPNFFSFKERIYLYPIKLLSRYAKRIITVSYSEKERLVRYDLAPAQNIDVVYNGVTPSFQPREKLPQERLNEVRGRYKLPKEFLLYVGRLNERKNIYNLIKAVSLLKNKTVPLVIAGPHDWQSFDMVDTVRQMGIEGRVIFTGFVADDDLPVVYSLAWLFCFVSFDEGFGLPALEAMAAGVPVVVSKCPPLMEVCLDAGNYADPEMPHDIASTIDVLLEDKELYETKRRNGLHRASQFLWKDSATDFFRSIERV
jgi:glycosyltransferase involved in cell wall biosynthesis